MSTIESAAHAVTPNAITRSRPALALALAVLALPGVTIAWELPGGNGGLYTGIPLALAALTLGVRAQPSRRARVAIGLASLALAYVAICTAFFA